MSNFSPKAPHDVDVFSIVFSAVLGVGETLTTAVVGVDPSGELAVQGVPLAGANSVSFVLAGGALGNIYAVTVTAGTSTLRTLSRSKTVVIADL